MNFKKSQSGFTMIEVMIVLAIAAIVLVGVLVAAQALQRAGRNQARQSDVGIMHAFLTDYRAKTGKYLEPGAMGHNKLTGTTAVDGVTLDSLQYYEIENIWITDAEKGPDFAANKLDDSTMTGEFKKLEAGSGNDKLSRVIDNLIIVRKHECQRPSISTGKILEAPANPATDLLGAGNINTNVIIYALEGDDLVYCR